MAKDNEQQNNNAKRDEWAYLPVGPSGQSKTETARAIAAFRGEATRETEREDAGKTREFIIFSFLTGAEKTSAAEKIARELGVSSLLGHPPGYESSEDSRSLAEQFADKAGVAVDEFEKGSCGTIENALRQMDAGKVTTNVKKRQNPGTKP